MCSVLLSETHSCIGAHLCLGVSAKCLKYGNLRGWKRTVSSIRREPDCLISSIINSADTWHIRIIVLNKLYVRACYLLPNDVVMKCVEVANVFILYIYTVYMRHISYVDRIWAYTVNHWPCGWGMAHSNIIFQAEVRNIYHILYVYKMYSVM